MIQKSLEAEVVIHVATTQSQDFTGKKLGRWSVNRRYSRTKWECTCDCGTRKLVWHKLLAEGRSKSCGCLRTEMMIAARSLSPEEAILRNTQDEKKLKHCCRCKIPKPGNQFPIFKRSESGRVGRYYICQECKNAVGSERRRLRTAEDPVRNGNKCRNAWLKRSYGLTIEDVDHMILVQKGLCAICQIPMPRPHVDHCHSTGRVRAMLCHKCNLGLGSFNDSPILLSAAILYLKSHSDAASSTQEI